MDLININELAVDCIIGINPSERTRTQLLIISAKLGVDLSCCAGTQNLNDTVNYADVCEELKALAINSKAGLLEVLADKMCNLIFYKHQKVRTIELTLLKPEAVQDAQGVGISIERIRSNYVEERLDYTESSGSPQTCAADTDPDILKFSLYRTCYKKFNRQWRENLRERGSFRRN